MIPWLNLGLDASASATWVDIGDGMVDYTSQVRRCATDKELCYARIPQACMKALRRSLSLTELLSVGVEESNLITHLVVPQQSCFDAQYKKQGQRQLQVA